MLSYILSLIIISSTALAALALQAEMGRGLPDEGRVFKALTRLTLAKGPVANKRVDTNQDLVILTRQGECYYLRTLKSQIQSKIRLEESSL